VPPYILSSSSFIAAPLFARMSMSLPTPLNVLKPFVTLGFEEWDDCSSSGPIAIELGLPNGESKGERLMRYDGPCNKSFGG